MRESLLFHQLCPYGLSVSKLRHCADPAYDKAQRGFEKPLMGHLKWVQLSI